MMSLANIRALWTQSFPPRNSAPITEARMANQVGKVFIVTGGSSGIGYELTRILYGAGAKVYVLTRSKENATKAFETIKMYYSEKDAGDSADKSKPKRGILEFIYMDLEDLNTVRSAARDFLQQQEGSEGRLDVLFNNAGTGGRANAPLTKQGQEYHFGTNILGGFLLSQLLAPILAQTASRSAVGSVRVVWPASMLVDTSPTTGIPEAFLRDPATARSFSYTELYSSSKTANWFVAAELAKRALKSNKVVQVAGNPGTYLTNIWRHVPWLLYVVVRPLLGDPVHGAETYLFMGFSSDITLETAAEGRYVINDGRWHPGQRKDLLLALKAENESGSGRSSQCIAWCEEQVKDFATAI